MNRVSRDTSTEAIHTFEKGETRGGGETLTVRVRDLLQTVGPIWRQANEVFATVLFPWL